MLEIIDLESWGDFENEIKSTINDQIESEINANVNGWGFDPILFRGQPNAEWKLQTTLERHVGENKPLSICPKISWSIQIWSNGVVPFWEQLVRI